jgi:hypothetical protein
MATYGIVHRFPGGTRKQYENVMKVVHPDDGKALPKGQMLHLAGQSQDGWLVMAVHDSWERFRDDTLMPGLASVDDGLPRPPDEMTFDVQVFQARERKT